MSPDDSSNWTFVRAFLFVAFSENQFLLTISLFTFIYEKTHEKVFEKSKSAEKFPACLKYFDGKINIQFPIRSGYLLLVRMFTFRKIVSGTSECVVEFLLSAFSRKSPA